MMKRLYSEMLDNITISQTVWDKSMLITMSDLAHEWYGMLLGRIEVTPNRHNPLVNNIKIHADDILIPVQEVSGSGVEVDSAAVSAMMTDDVIARMQTEDLRMIGWIHSHCRMGAFLSGTDKSNIEDELSMLPFCLSIVCSYSENAEYHPSVVTDKKVEEQKPADKITPATKAKDEPVEEKEEARFILTLKAKKRKSAIKYLKHVKINNKQLISNEKINEIKKKTRGEPNWRELMIDMLEKQGFIVKDPRSDKEPKNKTVTLTKFWNGAKQANPEFHMGVWFSHRPPFSENKATSHNLHQYELYPIITWPELQPRQLADLNAIVTADFKLETLAIMSQKINTRVVQLHAPHPHDFGFGWGSRIDRFLGQPARRGGIGMTIASCYSQVVQNSLLKTNHLSLYSPKIPERPVTRIGEYVRPSTTIRPYNCIFCQGEYDLEYTWNCGCCEEVEYTLSEIIVDEAIGAGFSEEESHNMLADQAGDYEEHPEFTRTVMDNFLSGECASTCLSSDEVSVACHSCRLRFTIEGDHAAGELEGEVCTLCGSQLLYLFHLQGHREKHLGILGLCNGCGQYFVYSYEDGQIHPSHEWGNSYHARIDNDFDTELDRVSSEHRESFDVIPPIFSEEDDW